MPVWADGGTGGGAAFERNFAFTRDVGEAFLDVNPELVRRRMSMEWTPEDKRRLLEWRGRYAEFKLVYDRGTLFGLKTGGTIVAILTSLPPRRFGGEGAVCIMFLECYGITYVWKIENPTLRSHRGGLINGGT